MKAIAKLVSFPAISAALMLSAGPVLAKAASPGHVTTSGVSAQSGKAAGGPVARRPKGCGHKTYGDCAFPTAPGATGGNDPRGPNRGPGNPTLHPK